MMGLFSQAGSHFRAATTPKPRGSLEEDRAPSDTEADDTSILDENEGSIISSLISQLRVGMDLSRVTFPTFVLEPRSMLERITDFMSHPDLIFGAEHCNDPEERFVRVLQYYLAGWHIKPKGVKKPYVDILVLWVLATALNVLFSDTTLYLESSSDAVSHHPPISAFFYISPANRVSILGELRPKSRFLGNSVSTTMEGENRVTLLGVPDDGEYIITMPNMYARGILFGKMVLELGDTCTAKNDKNGMFADLEFKTKGFFSGTYNAIAGRIRHSNTEVGELSGRWSHTMEIKSAKTGQKRVLFDAVKDGPNMAPKWVPPEDEQEPNESRRLWQDLTTAIGHKDMEAATDAKSVVEDAQRERRKRLDESGGKHEPRFFEFKNGRWVIKLTVPSDPEEAKRVVKDWIFNTTPSSPPTMARVAP
ncbi:hypothetical protein DXG01_005737 [Tephrocybe rancida]|nr:hypothetical protein DXG01_005737 [Tephrocybe rancida]